LNFSKLLTIFDQYFPLLITLAGTIKAEEAESLVRLKEKYEAVKHPCIRRYEYIVGRDA